MKNIQNYLIQENTSIKLTFEKIEKNQHGIIAVVNNHKKVIGLATDGDIRRYLISGHKLEDPIKLCMNQNFTYSVEQYNRESLLKLLDHRIRVIPILSKEGELVDIYSADYFPLSPQYKIYARAKSPVRVSFGGGGTDLTHYFVKNGGVVINATISIFSHAALSKRDDQKICIYSDDFQEEINADCLEELLQKAGRFDLIHSVLKLIHPDYGFNLEIGSEYPMASGLGGSAVVLSAIIGCFNQFRQDQWDRYEIAEIAFQAERLTMDMAGGWQDQYSTTFGGFNFMEFSANQNIVHPLRISKETLLELEESLILCNTGVSHHSGKIHQDQKKSMQKDEILNLVKKNKDLTYEIKNNLLRGRLMEFGKALHKGWSLKRQFSDQITNNELDEIYQLALNNGAAGGKLLGAGGGGFFLFYVEPFKKYKLMNILKNHGLEVTQFTFDNKGLQAWTVRETNNSAEK